MKLKKVYTVIIFCLLLSFSFYNIVSAKPLKRKLIELRAGVRKKNLLWNDFEIESLNLLKEHKTDKEKGEVYAFLALTFANKKNSKSGVEKIKKYSILALQYPQKAPIACEVYVRLAYSLMKEKWYTKDKEFSKMRREASIYCLKGIQLALENNVPEKRKKLPFTKTFGRYDNLYTDSEIIKEERKRKEIIALREKTKKLNKFYYTYKFLKATCSRLYQGAPYNTKEFLTNAKKIVKDEKVIKEILNDIEYSISVNSIDKRIKPKSLHRTIIKR